MIDLYEGCYGQGEKAITLQRQNVEAYKKTLSDQTIMGTLLNSSRWSSKLFNQVFRQASPADRTCQKLADQVGTFDLFLEQELNWTLAGQEANQQPVTLNMMFQMIKRELGKLSNKKSSTGLSSKVRKVSAEKKQGNNFRAHFATIWMIQCHKNNQEQRRETLGTLKHNGFEALKPFPPPPPPLWNSKFRLWFLKHSLVCSPFGVSVALSKDHGTDLTSIMQLEHWPGWQSKLLVISRWPSEVTAISPSLWECDGHWA